MTENKTVKVHNKSDKPDNVVQREHVIKQKCAELEKELPSFMRGFFAYLRGNVLPRTRLAYLQDLKFFCQYLITQRARIEDRKRYPQVSRNNG